MNRPHQPERSTDRSRPASGCLRSSPKISNTGSGKAGHCFGIISRGLNPGSLGKPTSIHRLMSGRRRCRNIGLSTCADGGLDYRFPTPSQNCNQSVCTRPILKNWLSACSCSCWLCQWHIGSCEGCSPCYWDCKRYSCLGVGFDRRDTR